jgi:TonB family protein
MPLVILFALLFAADHPILRAPSMPASKLVSKVDPVYPPLALERRIHGAVRFQVIIATDGTIERLRLLSGHPLLVPAAREAVKQWIYEPTLLNGKPARVITQISVPFELDRKRTPPVAMERRCDEYLSCGVKSSARFRCARSS